MSPFSSRLSWWRPNGGGTLLLPENFGHLPDGGGTLINSRGRSGPFAQHVFPLPRFHVRSVPGIGTAQGGVYVACEDTAGNVKILKALKRGTGMRLGIAHVGDWPTSGERTLEYDVVLGSFQGDWYDAADLYRDWTLRQTWATPLLNGRDVPAWVLGFTGVCHGSSARLHGSRSAWRSKRFSPTRNACPRSSNCSASGSALAVILMAWERGGPWVYPDCFPPAGGDEAMRRFGESVRDAGLAHRIVLQWNALGAEPQRRLRQDARSSNRTNGAADRLP